MLRVSPEFEDLVISIENNFRKKHGISPAKTKISRLVAIKFRESGLLDEINNNGRRIDLI